MVEKWWHWLEREDIPVIYAELRDRGHAFDEKYRDFTGGLLGDVFVWKGKVLYIYYKHQDMKEFKEFFVTEIISESDFLDKLKGFHMDFGEELIKISKDIENKNFSKLDNKKILKILNEFESKYYNLALYTYIPVIGTFALEDVLVPYLKDKLSEKGQQNKYGDYFSILSHHPGKSWKRMEEEALWKITSQIKKGKEISDSEMQNALNNHVKDFCWIETAYQLLGKPLNKDDFIKEMDVQIEKGLEKMPTEEEMNRKFDKIVKELKIDREHQLLFRALGLIIYLKEYRDGVYNWAHYALNYPIAEVVKRFSLEKKSYFFMKFSEFKKLLEGAKVDLDEIGKRDKYFVWLCDRKESYLTGRKAEEFIEKELDSLNINKEFNKILEGNVASPGFAKGRVKIIHNESELGKVKEGDILVAYMTKPSYISAMKKAAAFVTNEGGVTCHAAIVSREMKKPCVIGTKIATKVLHDGDLVEVDANRGIVRILEKAG